MKSKMVLVLSSIFLMACSGFVSGATHTKKTVPDVTVIDDQPSLGVELNSMIITEYVTPFESPAYILINGSSNVKPKVTEYFGFSAILIDFAMDFTHPPDPLDRSAVGTPDTKRYHKYLFERQKIC